ncbi:MAG: PEP-CTERM sorting domain-containing protein [Akkermansiaceae bacterium]
MTIATVASAIPAYAATAITQEDIATDVGAAWSGFETGDFARPGKNANGALTFTGYVSFDLSAAGLTAAELDLASFNLAYDAGVAGGSPSAFSIIYLGTYSSGTFGDGGTNNHALFTGAAAVSTSLAAQTATTGNQSAAVDLDDGSFAEDHAVFRMSLDNPGDNANGAQWDPNNFVLTVTPVPEPSSTALLGLGGLALIMRRRK